MSPLRPVQVWARNPRPHLRPIPRPHHAPTPAETVVYLHSPTPAPTLAHTTPGVGGNGGCVAKPTPVPQPTNLNRKQGTMTTLDSACTQCDADHTTTADPDLPNVWHLTIHHDDDCPFLAHLIETNRTTNR